MNNKHQELIAEKVAEVCNKIKLDYLLKADSLLRGMCLDKELRIVLTQTLQDTIDTVAAEERERVGKRYITLMNQAIGDTKLPEDVWKKIAKVNQLILDI